ncbi:MAG: response regulator [Aeromicrobium sp.]|uniref:response regulator n=1 Tax=Aeromicrobium sp. TaxID=1871063 RepID=UPI0026072348|nr:response regulator [Aeromicrobium sp.]MCW2823612.1 response regulator [Aeromicrobium sp.]
MPKVLVVDDTPSIRFLIRTNMELAGIEVEEAVDGVDCLAVLRTMDVLPDAITVDVMMPRLDGVATVTAIRSDPRLRHIAVVMVTTQNHPADIQRATQAGVDAYVTKPFDPDFLILTVRDVISKARNRDRPA